MTIPLYDDAGHHATQWAEPADYRTHCDYLVSRGFTGVLMSFADPFSPNTPLRQPGVNGSLPIGNSSGTNFTLNPTYAVYVRGLIDEADAAGLDVVFQTFGVQNWIGTSSDNGTLRVENAYDAGQQLFQYFGSSTAITHLIHGWDTSNERFWEDQIWESVVLGWDSGVPPQPSVDDLTGVNRTGSMIFAANLDNMRVGYQGFKFAVAFRPMVTSSVTAIKLWLRVGGQGYSDGDGGTYRVTVRTDNNDAPGSQVGTAMEFTPGLPTSSDRFLKWDWPTPVPVTADTTYFMHFENIHAQPLSNYLSINNLSSGVSGRRPARGFPAPNWDCYLNTAGSWYNREFWTAIMPIYYSDGHIEGSGYTEASIARWEVIGGGGQIRQLWTQNGRRHISKWGLGVGASSAGTLTGTLRDSGGTTIATATASSTIMDSISESDTYPSRYATWATFTDVDVWLEDGEDYSLTFTAASGRFVSHPIRSGHLAHTFPEDSVWVPGRGQVWEGGQWLNTLTHGTNRGGDSQWPIDFNI